MYDISKEVKFIEIETRMVVCSGWGRGSEESFFNGYEFSALLDERVLEVYGTTICIYLIPLNLYTSK